MANLRFKALEAVQNRSSEKEVLATAKQKVSSLFGVNVFTKEQMQKYLPEDVFEKVLAIETGAAISRELADQVANAMKSWAVERGATHYTHWFQPLTGLTAEKHDAFFELDKNNRPIELFAGSALVQQEPDASSFPSGGIRNTFEARGYSAWDTSSPAFIFGNTLCIPTIFISYTGETLDYKAPLLKTIRLIDQAATSVCQFFDEKVTKVSVTLGAEQEYFLIDSALYYARPDLYMTGRTLVGAPPARGQQLEDHYFGSIPARVMNFMMDMEEEAYRLGIPLKTRHNEVAPSQFECAPRFENLNIAVDHNQLLMDVMEKVARKHDLAVLFHEKPFAGINGSGKHNNWSLGTNTGKNLLSPGKTPQENLQFLTFFVCTIKAVHDYAPLLRASIASAGNDHRLGANEAPPAIISVFIGSQLDAVLQKLETSASNQTVQSKSSLNLNIPHIPEILKDNTDRNRTSPFAFTGNKFEFRAVGSSANNAPAMIVLNTIVANQLLEFKQEVEKRLAAGENKESAILSILREYSLASKAIRFEGNGYSDEWKEEAKKRGLANIPDTPRALDAYVSKESYELFTKHHIFSEREIHARWEIRLETYIKKIQIESRVLGEMCLQQILPAAISYQAELTQTATNLAQLGIENQTHQKLIHSINQHVSRIYELVEQMTNARKAANAVEEIRQRAILYRDTVFPLLSEIRLSADELERIVCDERWPLPKYRELLFLR